MKVPKRKYWVWFHVFNRNVYHIHFPHHFTSFHIKETPSCITITQQTRRLSTNKQNIEHRNTGYWGTASCSSLISEITSFRTITFSDELSVAYTSSVCSDITIFLGVRSYELLFLISRTKDSTLPRFRTICTLRLKSQLAATEKPRHHSRNQEKYRE